ncbi:MAG TPA: hypothetical protein VMH31_10835 [Methylomirabilota bacterium]|nr:hypothetical protein [Methylomirabilota bacterium]
MCELNSPAALAPVREAIEAQGPTCHFFESFFLVATDKSPRDLQRALHLRIDGQAAFHVSQLAHEHTSYLPQEALDWLATQRRENQDSHPGLGE